MAKIKFKRNTAAGATASNPVLAAGEPGYETDTGNIKIGDGITAWNSLSYAAGVSQLKAKSDAIITHKSKTASHTLDADDLADVNAGKVVHFLFDAASATTLTIPPNSTRAFSIGSLIFVTFTNTAAVSFVAGVGVTLTSADGSTLSTRYKSAYAEKIGTDQWLLNGALTT